MEKREQIQLAVIGAGLAVLAFFIFRNLKSAGKRPAAPAASAAVSAVQPSAAATPRKHLRDTIAVLQERQWAEAWGRDPFRALSDTAGKLIELQLKGISFSPTKQGFAFINDQILTIGDTIRGYTVSRIEKDRVLLTRGSQTFILSFVEN